MLATFTRAEIVELLAAARQLGPQGGLRPAVMETLFGLVACTGLRISEALGLLETQRWSGNVRELANVLERAVIRARGAMVEAADLGLVSRTVESSSFPAWLPLDLVQLERLAISEALRRTNGNRTHAARLLNLGLRTLRQKLNGPATEGGDLLAAVAP